MLRAILSSSRAVTASRVTASPYYKGCGRLLLTGQTGVLIGPELEIKTPSDWLFALIRLPLFVYLVAGCECGLVAYAYASAGWLRIRMGDGCVSVQAMNVLR